MVHSVELVFDPDTEAAIRHIWDGLREAGMPSQAPASRPHATLTVAERIDPEVDALLAPLTRPVPVPMPDRRAAVVRQVQGGARAAGGADDRAAGRARRGAPAVPAASAAGADGATPLPGQWTAHVTLARRVVPAQLGRALRIAGKPPEIAGQVVGLRRWDGNTKREYPIR